MFGILVSAFNVALGFVLRTVVVKFILFLACTLSYRRLFRFWRLCCQNLLILPGCFPHYLIAYGIS